MPALVFTVMRRSSAARAAHREQARSYICFGPIIPGADAHIPLALTSISWGHQGGRARRHSLCQGGKVPALVFTVMRRSSAARAAHREQARSYICFGPIIPGADAHVPLALTSISWGHQGGRARRHSLCQGGKVPALVFTVMRRSSAARAAHREQARSYICFGPVIPGADAHVPLALTSISRGTNRAVACAGTVCVRAARCLPWFLR